MATVGYASSCGTQWILSSMNQIEFPDDKINNNEILNGWSISSLFFEIAYDLASEKYVRGPHISLFYTLPIAGKYYPKISSIGGSFHFSFIYDF